MLRLPKAARGPSLIVAILTITYLILKLSIINVPSPELPPSSCIDQTSGCGFVFDEAHYLPAVRKMLRGEPANNEHPPLVKYLIMYSIQLFGDVPLAWRLPSAILGSLTLPFVYLIARRLTGDVRVGLVAVALFFLDVMSFNLSSIAILDAPSLFFALSGAYLMISGRRPLGIVMLAASALSKTSALLTALGIIVFDALYSSARSSDSAERASKLLNRAVTYLLVLGALFTAGLAVYDTQYGAFPHPFAHLDFILSYHSSLRFSCGETLSPLSCTHRDQHGEVVVELPLSWVMPVGGFRPMGFYVVSVAVDGRVHHPILYYGIQSPLWWLFWVTLILSLPQGLLLIVNYFRGKSDLPGSGSRAVDVFYFIWAVSNYFVHFPLAYLLNRWVYPFYFYFTVPILAIVVADILMRRGIPGYIAAFTLGAQLMWFIIYYPVRSDAHIALLRLLGLPA
jgi:4-amino-4-deoxy-L-arabinose transferase-like glycosyltransferase